MEEAGLLILVADDDKVTRETVGTVLEEEGYRVVLAKDGADALVGFTTEQPDLVLTDLNMPGHGGLFVVEQVRATHPWLPVIIFTADATLDAERKARAAGASDFINKPVDLQDMLSRVAACLSQRDADPNASQGAA